MVGRRRLCSVHSVTRNRSRRLSFGGIAQDVGKNGWPAWKAVRLKSKPSMTHARSTSKFSL